MMVKIKKYMILLLGIMLLNNIFAAVDSNGVWHLAEDVRNGTFGSDEETGDYYFPSKLGIGTTTPSSYFLDVSGTSRLTGNVETVGNLSISGFLDIGVDAYIGRFLSAPTISAVDVTAYVFLDADNSIKYKIDPSLVSYIEKLEVYDSIDANSIDAVSMLTLNGNPVATEIYTNMQVTNLNTSLRDYVNTQDSTLKTYIDTQDSTLKTYVNTQDNNLKSYVDTQDSTLKTYVNTQVTNLNTSLREYVNTQDNILKTYVNTQDNSIKSWVTNQNYIEEGTSIINVNDVDTNVIQQRVTGTCASGGIISINQDGSVECEVATASVDKPDNIGLDARYGLNTGSRPDLLMGCGDIDIDCSDSTDDSCTISWHSVGQFDPEGFNDETISIGETKSKSVTESVHYQSCYVKWDSADNNIKMLGKRTSISTGNTYYCSHYSYGTIASWYTP